MFEMILATATIIGGIAVIDNYFLEGRIKAYLALIVRGQLKKFRSKPFSLEEPEGTVPLGSPFYVERPPIESDCYETIMQPGALIRIKAPRKMGKTSLMTQILHHAIQQGCQKAHLIFLEAKDTEISDIDQFLRWFCTKVTEELDLPNKVDDYWNGTYEGSKYKCKSYFQQYLLPSSNSPVVLGLDQVEQIFPYPDIATEFFGLLRAWHERGKNEPVWKKLRFIIVYAEEINVPLDINQSPFNVGTHIELPDLNLLQVQDLAQRHELNWYQNQAKQLMNMVGGHPYLVRVALYHVKKGMILDDLLQVAPTEQGPYFGHLHNLLSTLKSNANLANAFKQVITANSAILLDDTETFNLRSMGLVKFQDGDTVVPLCELYRLYFDNKL